MHLVGRLHKTVVSKHASFANGFIHLAQQLPSSVESRVVKLRRVWDTDRQTTSSFWPLRSYSYVIKCFPSFFFLPTPSAVTCAAHASSRSQPSIHPDALAWRMENICVATRPRLYFTVQLSIRLPRSCILKNKSAPVFFCSAECDSQSVSPSPPWAGQLSLFFTLKRDLLRILTCDKLYTLLITCQLERWNCAF